jgi:hypothetical protein
MNIRHFFVDQDSYAARALSISAAFYVPLGVLLNGLLLIIIRVCRSAQQGVQNVGFFTNSLEQKFF